MPVKPLPPNSNLDHLKHQAKDLLQAHAVRDRGAAQRLREFHPRFLKSADAEIFAARLKLSDSLLAVARERGFSSWVRLKGHVLKPLRGNELDLPHQERIEDSAFRHAVDLLDAGDVVGLRAHLITHPGLARRRVLCEGGNYFRSPSLLEFVAENPVRHGVLPANIAAIAGVILEAGVEQAALDETLMLVSTGQVSRECRLQIPLIDLLCRHGADPDAALEAAVVHGEVEAAAELIACGARLTLPVTAGLGRHTEFMRLLPSATSEERHLALSVAADHGYHDIVKALLDAGEDPNRYNPVGGHAHTTPLHQAAWRGYENIVRLLVEEGACVDMRDILWSGTAAEWAAHGGHKSIEAYLRQRQALLSSKP